MMADEQRKVRELQRNDGGILIGMRVYEESMGFIYINKYGGKREGAWKLK